MIVRPRAGAPGWLAHLCLGALLTGGGCGGDVPLPTLVPAVAAVPDPALAGLPVRVADVTWHLDNPTSTEAARIAGFSREYRDRFVAGLIRANFHVLTSTDTATGALEVRVAIDESRDEATPIGWTVTITSGPDVVEVVHFAVPTRVHCENVPGTCTDAMRDSNSQQVVNALVTSAKVREWARRSRTPPPVIPVKAPEPVVVPAPPPPVAVVVPPPPASPGCVNDAQCKGDRICEDGKCVTPSPAALPPARSGPAPAVPPPRAAAPATPECRRRCRAGEALNAAGCCEKQ